MRPCSTGKLATGTATGSSRAMGRLRMQLSASSQCQLQHYRQQSPKVFLEVSWCTDTSQNFVSEHCTACGR